MVIDWRRARSWLIGGACALALLAGAALAQPPALPPTDAEEAEAAADAKPLTLEQLIELASEHNPTIAIARTRVQAARGRLIQAGLYPNPTITWEAEDMNGRDSAAGAQGPVIGQDIVTAGKRRRAMAAAAHGVSVADWQALTRWYDVLTKTRLAYFDLLAARLEVATSEEIVGLARLDLAAARKLVKAGTGVKPDELRAQVQFDQSIVQLGVSRQRLTAAAQLLIAAVGVPDLQVATLEGNFPALVPNYQWQGVLDRVLADTAPVQEAHSAVLQAEEFHALAKAQKCPDVRLQVRPLYNFPDQRGELSVWIGAAVPLFNRNQGNIVAAEADLVQARRQVQAVELRLREQLASAFQRYEAARQQSESYQKNVLPNARESLRLIRLGYEKGDPKYDFTAVSQAQQVLAQAQLVYVRALADLWRAVSEIAGMLQQDDLRGEK